MANDLNLSDIQRLEAKVDLVFGIISNQILATQAIDAYQATADKTDEDSMEIKQKSEQAFKYHSKNMIDSVDFYITLFGKESNETLVGLLKKAGFRNDDNDENDKPENMTAPDVKVSSSRKSVDVDEVDEAEYFDDGPSSEDIPLSHTTKV